MQLDAMTDYAGHRFKAVKATVCGLLVGWWVVFFSSSYLSQIIGYPIVRPLRPESQFFHQIEQLPARLAPIFESATHTPVYVLVLLCSTRLLVGQST